MGTVTADGDVTTVINESGSLWGGTATLVEEASIGLEAGEDAHMLGRVRGLAASDDRIYVVDDQVPALRVYDWFGTYMHDLGRQGEGPGELQYPSGVGLDETGRVWLHDQVSTRIVVFSPSDDVITTLNLGGTRISGETNSVVVTPDGHAYVFDVIRPDDPAEAEDEAFRVVMRPFGIDGVAGEPIDMPRSEDPAYLEARTTNAVRFTAIPFQPNLATAFTPSRAVLSGHPDRYRFEIRHPDGRRTMVERWWEPVAVLPDEAAAHESAAIAYMRDMDPAWVWSGPEIPATKPAFSRLVPAISGEIWVIRPGPATRKPDCDEEEFELDGEAHCWPEQRTIDAFDAEGRYLGEVAVPDDLSFQPLPFIRGTDVIARVEDAAGTIMVKRYRLVLPGKL